MPWFLQREAEKGERQARRGEQYSIRLRKKALHVVKSSGGPRKDFVRRRMPSRRLAVEARLEMRLSQERSWQVVRPRSLNERASSRGLLRKSIGGFFKRSFRRDRVRVRFVRIERHVPCVGPACDFIQICRVKRLLLADLRDDRWCGKGWSHQ